MTFSAISIWIVQASVTWLVYRDLGPAGSGFVARSLGLQPGYWIWAWLVVLMLACILMGSRVAANAFAAYTGKRPPQDWQSYGRSGAAQACYWCGLASFGISLLAAQAFPNAALPGLKAVAVCGLALLVNRNLTGVVVQGLLRRQYRLRSNGRLQRQSMGTVAR